MEHKGPVFRFNTIEICLTIEVYARLIGVSFDCEKVVNPSFESAFKQRLSRTLGNERNSLGRMVTRQNI